MISDLINVIISVILNQLIHKIAKKSTMKEKLSLKELVIKGNDTEVVIPEGTVVAVSKVEVYAPRTLYVFGILRCYGRGPYVEAGAAVYVAPGGKIEVW